MSKVRGHKIKKEFKDADQPIASTSTATAATKTDHYFEEKDLTYYLHDRVELMHQVFSILKTKELMAMAPDCLRNLSIDDVQELCLEEVLGISSKRLCAILDGADPPSDTETSSSDESVQAKPSVDQLETISLDSISSDEVEDEEEHKSVGSKNSRPKKHSHAKKHKHTTHSHQSSSQPKPKDKHKASDSLQAGDNNGDSKAAERAGMTVLELLELQARARAIRAQLALENTTKDETATSSKAATSSKKSQKSTSSSSDTEDSSHHSSVCIKEEPPEVLEVPGSSSEDEKTVLQEQREKRKKGGGSASTATAPQTATTSLPPKKSDLTVIVPQTHSRKIKLKRNKVVVQVTNVLPDKKSQTQSKTENKDRASKTVKILENTDSKKTSNKTDEIIEINEVENDKREDKTNNEVKERDKKASDKSKKTKTKKSRHYRRHVSREGSDHDEITLQLSDTEKMDLLENIDPKNYENVSSSSSNEESDEETPRKNKMTTQTHVENLEKDKTETATNNDKEAMDNVTTIETDTQKLDEKIPDEPENTAVESPIKETVTTEVNRQESNATSEITISAVDNSQLTENNDSNTGIEKKAKVEENNLKEVDKPEEKLDNAKLTENVINTENENNSVINKEKTTSDKNTRKDEIKDPEEQKSEITEEELKDNKELINKETEDSTQMKTDIKSDGEISEKSSSDIEMLEKPPEIICISDEEEKEAAAKKSKKNKKEKKSKKKSKKHSKKSGFHKAADRDSSVQRENEEELSATDNIVIVKENDRNNMEDIEETAKEANSKQVSKVKEVIKSVKKERRKDINKGNSENLEDDTSDLNYEIYEISDDSSGSETDLKLLSKEPTSEEIEELSHRIDTEIEREEIITEDQMRTSNVQSETDPIEKCRNNVSIVAEESGKNEQNIEEETMSWKHRWLESKKVQRVMVTSNILNAMRKKNKELKFKLAQKKNETDLPVAESGKGETTVDDAVEENPIVEGSIDHYNTLEGSTKYVDPVIEPKTTELDKSMRKDAKQLMKMYKKLVKAYSKSTKSESERKAKKERKKAEREKKKALLTAKNAGEEKLNQS